MMDDGWACCSAAGSRSQITYQPPQQPDRQSRVATTHHPATQPPSARCSDPPARSIGRGPVGPLFFLAKHRRLARWPVRFYRARPPAEVGLLIKYLTRVCTSYATGPTSFVLRDDASPRKYVYMGRHTCRHIAMRSVALLFHRFEYSVPVENRRMAAITDRTRNC